LIEFVGGSVVGAGAAARLDGFASAIRQVGTDACILASDLGQKGNALPADGFAAFILALKARGFTDQELGRMAKQNPATLLGLR
jgi:predicted metal-dependent phosphotriesterase family hydrolase